MTKACWLTASLVAGACVLAGAEASAQATSENAKDVREWSLKSGAGAPHNIMQSTERSRDEAALFWRIPKVSSEYVLGDGDRVDLRIVRGGGLNDSLKSLTVSNSGEISIPYIGTVKAAGLTASQLEERIAALFEEKQLLKKPEVLVYITDYRAKPFFVLGEVDLPGEYVMSQQLTLMEAILMAGGIDPDADSFAFLHRRKSATGPDLQPGRALQNPAAATPGEELVKIDLRPLKRGGVPKPDIYLRKGDILVIPKAKDMRFFVLGDVRSPGSKDIPPPAERPILVSQAIAQAGGPAPTARMSKGILIRYNESDGSREEKNVDFDAVIKGKQPDFEVRAGDIIFIPGSNAKSLAYGILGVLPQNIQSRTTTSLKGDNK